MEPMMQTPLVSVVMINWNRREILKQVLNNLSGQTYTQYEIVICDNNSTDGAPDMVEQEFPSVRLIRLNENVGIKGYNIAFDNSQGEIIVILDNDSYLERDGFVKIVKKFQMYPRLGAMGCKVYNYYTNKVHHWHPTVHTDEVPAEGVDAPLFNGCAGAARRSVLQEVGFYPEEYFLYENERDLCTRIINAGYKVKYFTDVIGYHMVADEGRTSERLVFFSTRNLIWYNWKYLPCLTAATRTASILLRNAAAAIRSRAFRMYLKPLVVALVGLPVILKMRRVVKREYLDKILY